MSRLYADAARMEIASPPGLKMAGFGARLEGAHGTHDPLGARALRLDCDETSILWITCDLIGFATDVDRMLRGRIASACGVALANVFISCTHTHGSVNSITFRGPLAGPDPAWLKTLVDQLTTLAAGLKPHAQPVRLTLAQQAVHGLGYNRQDAEVPIDETLTCLAIDAERDGRRLATLVHYALHPVILGERNLHYTADYPGAVAAQLERAADGIALFVQGTCGDVDPVNYRDLGRGTGTFKIAEDVGRHLASAAVQALRQAEPVASPSLAVSEVIVDLPMDPPPSRTSLAELREGFAAKRGPTDRAPATDDAKWAEFELEWADELDRAIAAGTVPATLPLRIAVACIGELNVVAVPAEIYSSIGLAMKRELAPQPTIVACYTGGVIGYIPTDRAKRQGGYGPAQSHRVFSELLTAVGFGAEDAIVTAAVAQVRRLSGGNKQVQNAVR